MISESELRSLKETAHLIRLLKNARRLIDAMGRAADDTVEPGALDELRSEAGLE